LNKTLHGVKLRIVASSSVHPHEVADAAREARIEVRLQSDSLLRDPIMVGSVPDIDGQILLDGTNRQRALAALRFPWILVQELDYSDPQAVQLRTWCHVTQCSLDEFHAETKRIPGIDTASLSPLEPPEALRDPATLAVLLRGSRRVVLRRKPDSEVSRAEQLRLLVSLYESSMTRVSCEPDEIEERAHILGSRSEDRGTLVAFPPVSRSQVVALAVQGTLIPAGITRHIIQGGRGLRINLPLSVLSENYTLQGANEALTNHLSRLTPRRYDEPTILFDS
jgi:hypothetical protein